MAKIIVVGAGSAGCVVAARLSASGEHQVTLLEAGPDERSPLTAGRLASLNWRNALQATDAFTHEIMATRLSADSPRPYDRGRGVGGSGEVNAMLALPGLPADYERWAEAYGIQGWSWDEVEPTFRALQKDITQSSPETFTPVDSALVDAAEDFGLPSDVDTFTAENGGGALYRHADEFGRRSSRAQYLEPARSHPNLEIVPNSPVRRVLVEDGRAVGVELNDKRALHADEVVLCAGAIETPAVLLRTGNQRRAVGQGLQDHPAASVFMELREEYAEAEEEGPCINSVLRLSSQHRYGDITLLPVHGALAETSPPSHGVLMAALMQVNSVGEVKLDPENPDGAPVVAERMLATEEDQAAMREAVDILKNVLSTGPFQRILKRVFIDESGTPLTALEDESNYQTWLNTSIGDYYHAVGTARMGRHDDPGAVVDAAGRVHDVDGLRVIDASVIPEVPRANTHLPVVMVAERLTAAMLTELADPQSTSENLKETPHVNH